MDLISLPITQAIMKIPAKVSLAKRLGGKIIPFILIALVFIAFIVFVVVDILAQRVFVRCRKQERKQNSKKNSGNNKSSYVLLLLHRANPESVDNRFFIPAPIPQRDIPQILQFNSYSAVRNSSEDGIPPAYQGTSEYDTLSTPPPIYNPTANDGHVSIARG